MKNSSAPFSAPPTPYDSPRPPSPLLPTPTSPMQQTGDESHAATCEYGGHGAPDTISERHYDGPEPAKDPA